MRARHVAFSEEASCSWRVRSWFRVASSSALVSASGAWMASSWWPSWWRRAALSRSRSSRRSLISFRAVSSSVRRLSAEGGVAVADGGVLWAWRSWAASMCSRTPGAQVSQVETLAARATAAKVSGFPCFSSGARTVRTRARFSRLWRRLASARLGRGCHGGSSGVFRSGSGEGQERVVVACSCLSQHSAGLFDLGAFGSGEGCQVCACGR